MSQKFTCPQCHKSECPGDMALYCPETNIYHDATDEALARQAAQNVAIMLDDPKPALDNADRDTIEAVRASAEGHEYVMVSRKSALRLLTLLDEAYPV